MTSRQHTFTNRMAGGLLAAAAIAGVFTPTTIAHAATSNTWSSYEATAPAGAQASDHVKFTVDSPTITAAMVGKTVVFSITGHTGVAVPDASSLHLQWYDGKHWHQGVGVSAPISNGPTVGLKMPVTQAMVGQRAQMYGQIQVADGASGSVALTGRSTIGATATAGTSSIILPALAVDPNTFWASPTGTGDGSTPTSPASITQAQQLARARMLQATGDVHVILTDGTYRTTQPIQFTAADSGTNGHRMVWTVAPGAHPIIDGAQQLTGWQPWAGKSGVYRTRAAGAVGNGTSSVYVNGVRAAQTSAKATDVLGTITLNGVAGTSIADTGYTVTKDISGWTDLQHTSLRWYGNRDNQTEGVTWEGWVDRRAPIASATATNITMGTDFINDYPGGTQGVNRPTSIENNLALIGTPGQFYIDQSQGWVYYTPRAGEDMSTADVELPVSQGLIRANGVHDFQIDGDVEFRHDSFSQATNNGLADGQAAVSSGTHDMLPGALQFNDSSNVSLNGIQVDQTGAAGIQFHAGSSHDSIEGANIWQTSGSGVELGDVIDGGIADALSVDHSRVVDAGQAYPSAPAVMAGYVADTSITHDTILGAPYSGVSLGWGWGVATSMGNNHIDNNRIEAMTDANLFDGGDIYVNGVTDATRRSTISNNWLSSMGSDGAEADPGHRSWDGKAASYSSIYLDGSANHYDVTSNVAQDTHQGTWLGVQSVSGQVAVDNHVTGNWADTAAESDGVAGQNTISNNQTGLSTMPTQALQVEKGI